MYVERSRESGHSLPITQPECVVHFSSPHKLTEVAHFVTKSWPWFKHPKTVYLMTFFSFPGQHLEKKPQETGKPSSARKPKTVNF